MNLPDPLMAPTANPPSSHALALKRTQLANNRTLLAFIRTSLGLGGFALAVEKLFHGTDTIVLSAALGAVAVVVLAFGLRQHQETRRFMQKGE